MSYTTIIAVQTETESRFDQYHTSYLRQVIVNLMSRETRRQQITQDTNKNYQLIVIISITNQN